MVCDKSSSTGLRMQNYKSLRAAVMVCAILVNTQTDTRTHTHTETRTYWQLFTAYTLNSGPAELKLSTCTAITVTGMNLYVTIVVTGTICTVYTTIVRTELRQLHFCRLALRVAMTIAEMTQNECQRPATTY